MGDDKYRKDRLNYIFIIHNCTWMLTYHVRRYILMYYLHTKIDLHVAIYSFCCKTWWIYTFPCVFTISHFRCCDVHMCSNKYICHVMQHNTYTICSYKKNTNTESNICTCVICTCACTSMYTQSHVASWYSMWVSVSRTCELACKTPVS